MRDLENEAWFPEFKRRAKSRTLKSGEVYILQGEEHLHIGVIVSGRVTAIAYSY